METEVERKPARVHPRAGTPMTGAEILVQILADEGTDILFGYSGGAILPVFDAVFRFNAEHGEPGLEPMPIVVPANEQGAGFMAAGYARASGKVGVALVTSGPGATNCVTPVRDCLADSVPMVLISGQISTAAIGSDAFQEAPIAALMGSVAKHVFLVTDPEKLESTVRTAFEIARTGRPGPVVVDVPKDVQNWKGVFRGEGRLAIPGYRARIANVSSSVLDERAVERFFSMLGESRRPLVYAGGGVIRGGASAELRALAEGFGIPVVTTLMGLGAVDPSHPLSLHMLGMHGTAYANYAVDDCDLLIAVAARFDDRVAGAPKSFAPRARRVLHLDIDPSEIHKVKRADWHFVGPLRAALGALVEHGVRIGFRGEFSQWHEEVRELKARYAMTYDRDSPLIQPHYVLETMNEITEGEAVVATGVGQHQMWAAQYCHFREPNLWLTSGSMGTMGFGLPAAIGAQFARPDKLVIDVDGDASIRMNLGELETVTTYDLPIKVLILNNFGDGMVMQWQRLFFKGRLSASDKSLRKKDFVRAAQADGFPYATRLDRKEEVPEVMEEFLSFDGPAFLEVLIDPKADVYPMVGPGLSYREMITGGFIPNRYEGARAGEEPDASEMF